MCQPKEAHQKVWKPLSHANLLPLIESEIGVPQGFKCALNCDVWNHGYHRHRLTRSLVLHRGCPWDKSCFRVQLEAATIANAQRLRASCLPTTPLSSRSLLAPLSKKKWNYSELAKRQVSTFYFHHSPKSFIAKCLLTQPFWALL